MMEVKHSPSSQMDFRTSTATNGLPTEEDEDMDTILEDGIGKTEAISTMDSDIKTPTHNGISKSSQEDNPSKDLDSMEIDLLEEVDDEDDDEQEKPDADSCDSKKEDEAEEPKEDLDLYELDLEEVVKDKGANGEITDASTLRDTGDDLDTLLSKINDLVEDCMEVKPGTVASKKSNDVEIIDNINEDISEEIIKQSDEELSLTETPKEAHNESEANTDEVARKSDTEFEAADLKETAEEVKEDETIEEEDIDGIESAEIVDNAEVADSAEVAESAAEVVDSAVTQSKEITEEEEKELTEEELLKESENEKEDKEISEVTNEDVSEETSSKKKMEVDDDEEIFCLDSPAPEECQKGDEAVNKESSEETPKEENGNQSEAEQEVIEKEEATTETAKKPVAEAQTPMEEDEIFLIDDDEDEEEPVKQTDIPAEPLEEKVEENIKEVKEVEKVEELPEEIVKEDVKSLEEIGNKTEVALEKDAPVEDEDDDIVCLDDSIEETEVDKVTTGAEKEAHDEHEEKKEEEIATTSVPSIEKLDGEAENISEEKLLNETEKDGLDKEKEEEQVSEKDAMKKNVQEVIEEAAADKDVKVDEKAEEQVEKADVAEEAVKIVTEKKEEELSDKTEVTDEAKPDSTTESKSVTEREKLSNVTIDNDIITLDDEDDEEMPSSENKDEESSSIVPEDKQSAVEEAKETPKSTLAFLSDNSDNARDGVEEKEEKTEAKVSATEETPLQSEANSNSSNLLKESALLEREESRSEPSEQPPSKRIRLSQDEANSRNSSASQDDTKSNVIDDDDIMEIVDKTDEDTKTLKRVHSSESISSDFKKPKTDIESETADADKVKDEKEDIKKVEPCKEEIETKKPVEVKPLALYPPPNLETPKISLSLDFLKRFKKSIHKMNKSDLEELVLQKIVEAIVHKSEFSEMRDMIEKQEKIISGHRTKITELNKQFRDLEMVHNRVLKDLETKNAQFIMPVKITRAVGLQVFFPNKKYDQPMASLNTASPVQGSVSSAAARRVSSGSGVEKSSIAPSTAGSNTTPMTSIPSAGATPGVPQQRRGCVQKLTPMRPDTPRNSPLNRSVTSGMISSASTTSPMTPKEGSPKILNRQVAQKPRLSQSPLAGTTTMSSLPQQATIPQQAIIQAEPEKPKAVVPQGIATKKTAPVRLNPPPSKRIPKSWQSEPQTISLPTPGLNSANQHVPQPNLNPSAPPKAPNKSVIDLTDEDDVIPAPSPRTPTVTTTVQQKPTATPSPNASGQRVYKAADIPPLQSAQQKVAPMSSQPVHRPYKVSVIPAHQLQQPKNALPKQISVRPSVPIAPKPNGTVQTTVRQGPPNPVKYRHPAPLPTQPIHSSNPLWKLPPARPTIRISNLDSGIVISWTIEDTAKDKYAESTSYQIYAYQETSGPPLVESWRHVGDVKAMLLPMAVTLTQFQEGQRYYFAVRAVDAHHRCGPFSFAKTWS